MKTPSFDPIAKRAQLGLTQTEFWTPVGVGQSSGSRYETGRAVPKPVAALLVLRYGTEKQKAKMLAEIQK